MRRLWLPLLIAVLLAACSSAPQKVSRGGPSSSENAWRTRPAGFPDFVDHSIGREEISIQAMGLVGIPYRWGGNTPDSGFDCSGLVRYVLARSASVDLPRTTAEMSTRGETIEPGEIAPGDLVFFNTTGRPHSHVGIYAGKLRFVNAPSTGGTVRLDYLTNPYWAKRFDGIRRMAPPRPTPFDAPTREASAPAERAPGSNTETRAAAMANASPAPATLQPVRAVGGSQNRVAAAPQLAYATAAPAAPVASTPAAAPADAFEPPPASLGAAQTQAHEAAVAPVNDSAYATRPVTSPAASAAASAPRDAIDAAADAFEPPPPNAAAAARQAGLAGSTPIQASSLPAGTVQIMRASTAGAASLAPTQSSDDPIARFANSGD